MESSLNFFVKVVFWVDSLLLTTSVALRYSYSAAEVLESYTICEQNNVLPRVNCLSDTLILVSSLPSMLFSKNQEQGQPVCLSDHFVI